MTNHEGRIDQLSPVKRAFLALEEMQARLDAIERARNEPIAIIGMACHFPGGATTPTAYWKALQDGTDAVTDIPAERWNVDAYYDPDPDMPDKMSTRKGSFIENVDLFDAAFFHISPYEAVRMDPQQRLLLEVAWEALEDGGQDVHKLNNSQTGVFIGISTTDYAQLHMQSNAQTHIDAYTGTGTTLSVAAGRISYTFGFQGPSMIVDTACSSSLVAVHLACQSLRSGESTMALAGGVNLILVPGGHIYLSKLHAMASDGHCKTFDAAADGFVRGEGCGVVVLKRLSDALAAGDPIHALIRGTAVNQDGRSSGLTVPNGLAQQAVIQKALMNANVEPGDIDYVEAHGTGTSLGDPIEVRALGNVYAARRSKQKPLLISSVKTNIGHLEAAAGIAGLIKTVLILKHQEIPPHLHFRHPNPHIAWETLAIKVPLEKSMWPGAGKPRLAGVSAFGYSGTNAHAILEEAPTATDNEPDKDLSQGIHTQNALASILPISAHHPQALYNLIQAYQQLLSSDASASKIDDICYSASIRRSHHARRLALVGQTAQEIAAQLTKYLQDTRVEDSILPDQQLKIIFVFPGQGSQWLGMGRELWQQEPVFRQALHDCEQAMTPYLAWSLTQQMHADEPLQDIDVVQPLLFALHIALARLWMSWGILPDAVMGHSMGEVAAAHIAGLLSLSDAARIICRRSQLLRRLRGMGRMALLEADRSQAQEWIAQDHTRLSIAACNGPRSTIVAGETSAIEALLIRLQAQGIFCRAVPVDVASHSPLVEPLRADLQAALQGITPQPGQFPMYSTVRGRWLQAQDLQASYWVDNLREPVQFWPGVQQVVREGYNTLLEISPHPVLVTAMQEGVQQLQAEVLVLSSLKRQQPERAALLQGIARLYEQGASIDWQKLFPTRGHSVPLPAYPWQHERFWLEVNEQDRSFSSPVQQKTVVRQPQRGFSKDAFLALSPGDYQQAVEQYLIQQLAQILGMVSSTLSIQASFVTLGIDSLMIIRLKNQIRLDLEIELSVEEILQNSTIVQLTSVLVEHLVITYFLLDNVETGKIAHEEIDTFVF